MLSEIWKANDDTVCMSTEEMIAEIDRVNLLVGERKIVLGSMDVKALYPSLDVDFTIARTCDVIRESDFKFEGLWDKEIGLYMAINKTPTELNELGVLELCPTRTTQRGLRPTMNSMRNLKEEKRFNNWADPARSASNAEKRTMIILALQIALAFIMKNHHYTFGGEFKRQRKGGPIGLDLTGALAQIFMIWWSKEFKIRLEQLQLEVIMMKIYVDDINQGIPIIEPGTRYIDGELVIKEDLVVHDIAVADDLRTMLIYQSIGNSIHPSIQLEIDCSSNHDDEKMPILDLKMWVVELQNGGSRIMHEFYMKSVSSRSVLNSESALAWGVKRTVLTQEALRVLLNCSRELPWETKSSHLSYFSARMQFSGYEHKFRSEVIRSALAAYDKLRKLETDGVRPLYRPREWNREERDKERISKKTDWYKRGGDDSVIFVPATPGSNLRKKMEEKIRKSSFKIRVVEKAGVSLKRKLQRSNPFKKKTCDRQNCLVCTTGGKGPCDAVGINYELVCEDCQNDGEVSKYVGQTSHSAFTRGKEHQSDLAGMRDSSKMAQHQRDKHGGLQTRFRMDVVGVYGQDAMLRQIAEAVRISNTQDRQLINSREEWNYIQLPNVALEQ
jgi:hypothetical protein